jgi:hypothetical protein
MWYCFVIIKPTNIVMKHGDPSGPSPDQHEKAVKRKTAGRATPAPPGVSSVPQMPWNVKSMRKTVDSRKRGSSLVD